MADPLHQPISRVNRFVLQIMETTLSAEAWEGISAYLNAAQAEEIQERPELAALVAAGMADDLEDAVHVHAYNVAMGQAENGQARIGLRNAELERRKVRRARTSQT